LNSLGNHLGREGRHTRDVSAWAVEARDESALDWVVACRHHHRDARGHPFRLDESLGRRRDDHIDAETHEFRPETWQDLLGASLAPADLEHVGATFHVSEIREPLT
jgi:hypothetical protein